MCPTKILVSCIRQIQQEYVAPKLKIEHSAPGDVAKQWIAREEKI